MNRSLLEYCKRLKLEMIVKIFLTHKYKIFYKSVEWAYFTLLTAHFVSFHQSPSSRVAL